MTWVRIDDRMPHHAKLRDAGEAAGWLWICGLCWCNAQVNDGHIRAADLACLYPGRWNAKELAALAQRLVDLELWHVEPGGFLVHGYAEEQREAMRDRVEARKEKDRNRKGSQGGSARNPNGSPQESERLPPPPGPGPGPGPGSQIPDSSRGRDPDQVARGRAEAPAESARGLEQRVCELFGSGYLARTGTAWMHPDQLAECLRGGGLRSHAAVRDQVRAVAGWAAAQESPDAALVGVVDAWFRDPFGERCGYSLAGLAKTVARVAASQPLAPPSKHTHQPALRPEDF